MQLIGYCVLVTLAIIVCASFVPICEYFYFSFIKKKKGNQKVYQFSKELFEAEYCSEVFNKSQKRFEEQKKQEYCQKLP